MFVPESVCLANTAELGLKISFIFLIDFPLIGVVFGF
jgi:hypothetical protein